MLLGGKVQPTTVAEAKWFQDSECDQALQALAKDIAFFMKRQENEATLEKGLTHFNNVHDYRSPEVTNIGYMPIVQAPAREQDTLHTLVLRCKYISRKHGQHHVVFTVDEA